MHYHETQVVCLWMTWRGALQYYIAACTPFLRTNLESLAAQLGSSAAHTVDDGAEMLDMAAAIGNATVRSLREVGCSGSSEKQRHWRQHRRPVALICAHRMAATATKQVYIGLYLDLC